MDKLAEEILGALYGPIHATVSQEDAEKASIAAAEVAKRWIEKALRDGSDPTFTDSKGNLMKKVQDVYVNAWFEENNFQS
jgi:hypothetical protein